MAKSVFRGDFRITGCFMQNWGYWSNAHPHTGLDLVGDDGKQIYAPISGRIGFAGNSGDGFGNYVRIEDAKGVRYYFCHMERVAVSAEQQVNAGDLIGIMGHTGNVTGAHTHFEIRVPNGKGGYTLGNPADLLGIPNRQGSYNSNQIEKPAMTVIDQADGSCIRGWGLNPDGVKRFDIYVDNNQGLGSCCTFLSRPDVARVFPSYPCASLCGYCLNVTGKLGKGKHNIKVAAIPKNGGPAQWAFKDITV